MLQSMRHLAQSWVVKGLMLLLIVSFGIWGIGDIFKGNPLQRVVATVGSDSVSVQELSHEFDRSLVQLRRSLGPDFSAQQAKQMGLLDMTLNNVIGRKQVDQETQRLGINVSAGVMAQVFQAVPQFHDKDGKFSKDLMREALRNQGLNERDFVDAQRQEMTRHQLTDTFSDSNPLPALQIESLYKARGQKRILDVVTLQNSSIQDIPAPDDKALHVFYAQNPKLFTAPEYRSITIAQLATDDIAKEISISDEDVQKEYDARSAQLQHPERRDLLQVVLQNEDKAKALALSARSTGDLSAAAKTLGYETIPLNGSDKGGLLPGLAEPVFAMTVGQVSDPIKSPLGWHVMQVVKIIPAGIPPLDEVKNELRLRLQRDQAVDSVTKTVNQWDDELAAGHSLDDIADGMKLRLIKIVAIDANGKTPEGKDPPELPHKADILKNAFGQNGGETSPVMDDRNGNYFVVRTDDITASAVRPFDTVAEQVSALWKAHAQADKAKKAAEQIAQMLRDGKTTSSLEGQPGIEVRVAKPISELDNSDPSLPQAILPQILKMKVGEAFTWGTADQQLVLHLSNLVNADDDKSEAARAEITEQMRDDMKNELASQYLKYLRQTYPVSIRQGVLDSVSEQGS